MHEIQVPSIDPVPLPAPYWVFKILLLITFLLHIIAMNSLLGGGILSVFAKIKSKSDEQYQQLYSKITHLLPSFLAATITLGVAPLLFLQVIYGQYFYTSTVIMGWPWLMVILILTFAYYGLYYVSFRKSEKGGWVLPFSVLLIAAIGFIYSTNMTLMVSPEKWMAKYLGDTSGWNMNWSDISLYPRYLHFLFGATAVGGLMIVVAGLLEWNKNESFARFMIRFGGKAFMYVTMIQIVIGLIFLIALPKEQMMIFMGKNMLATILLLVGILLAIGVIFTMNNALHADDPRGGAKLTIGLTIVLLLTMVIMRDLLRDAYLAKYFNASQFSTATQWSVFILFLILFIAGVVLWIKMIHTYFFNKDSLAEN
jgi:hypothetical protein